MFKPPEVEHPQKDEHEHKNKPLIYSQFFQIEKENPKVNLGRETNRQE